MNKNRAHPLSSNIIANLNLHEIVIFSKPPNIIATNISRFTVHVLLQKYRTFRKNLVYNNGKI